MDNTSTKDIEKLLMLLNVKGRCSLHQTAYALTLVLQDKEYLSHITKGLYQDVAKKHKTNWRNVERNIRCARDMVWNEGRELLEEINRGELITRPSNTEFLNMLADYIESSKEASAVLEMAVTDISLLSLLQPMIREIESLKKKINDLQSQMEILRAEKSSPKE